MAQNAKKTTLLRKQPAMRRVLIGLTPCAAGSIYFFGWRSLAMMLFCCAVGFLTEWLFCRRRKEPVSEAVFVTAVLFALTLPPLVGWHVMAVGMVFAVFFTKEVFGGFGKNIFNPAIAGRCFVYICFPLAMTSVWPLPAQGGWGALGQWSTASVCTEFQSAITSATPGTNAKMGRIQLVDSDDPSATVVLPLQMQQDQTVSLSRTAYLKAFFFGRIPGSMGATSALLMAIGGLYLFITKTASRTIILTMLISFAAFNAVFYWFGVKPFAGAIPALLSGGFILGACFMATDPVSCPRTEQAKIIYAILIAFCTLVIRNFSIFNGGLMFSILIGNMFAPILDYAVKVYWPARPKAVAAKGAK